MADDYESRMAEALRSAEREVPPDSEWRHKRTGNVYQIDQAVILQMPDSGDPLDQAVAIVYGRGMLAFVRPLVHFLDRFERVTETQR